MRHSLRALHILPDMLFDQSRISTEDSSKLQTITEGSWCDPRASVAAPHLHQVRDVLLQNHFRSTQDCRAANLAGLTLASPFVHGFLNPHFRCPHNLHNLPPRSGILATLFGHLLLVERGGWGFEKKEHVTGCDLHHKCIFQARRESINGFYLVTRLRLDETKRITSKLERPCDQ